MYKGSKLSSLSSHFFLVKKASCFTCARHRSSTNNYTPFKKRHKRAQGTVFFLISLNKASKRKSTNQGIIPEKRKIKQKQQHCKVQTTQMLLGICAWPSDSQWHQPHTRKQRGHICVPRSPVVQSISGTRSWPYKNLRTKVSSVLQCKCMYNLNIMLRSFEHQIHLRNSFIQSNISEPCMWRLSFNHSLISYQLLFAKSY